MSAVLALAQNQKILLVTAERIGDALFCTPAIGLLKKQRPDLQIDLLAFHQNAADIFRHNPDVHTVRVSQHKRAIREIAKSYRLVINLTYEFQSYLAKVSTPWISIEKPDRTVHRAEQALRFMQAQLACTVSPADQRYRLYPQAADVNRVKTLLQEHGIDSERDIVIGCQLGCHRVARRGWQFWRRTRHQHRKVWPLEHYIALAQQLHATHPQVRFVLTGSPSEAFLAKHFLREVPWADSFIGRTSLFELAALMDHLNVLLTHDTGTLHIACTREVSLVTLFGPTALAFTGPYPLRPTTTVIAKASMADIAVNEVYTALLGQIPALTHTKSHPAPAENLL